MPVGAHAQQALSPDDVAAIRAEIATLKMRLQSLEARVGTGQSGDGAQLPVPAQQSEESSDNAIAAAPDATPAPNKAPAMKVAWKGSPQMKEGDWSFKPKGRIQFDTGYATRPDGTPKDFGLGNSTEVRRLRMGAEGSMPGNFGYKLEVELADNAVDLVDTYISWQSGGFKVRLGNQNEFQSLDELIGDTTGTVMERAAFTDAFNFERRMGLAVEWQKGPLLLQGGVFTDDVKALSATNGDENNSYGVDGRIVFAPKIGDAQFHLAASGHWRDLQSTSEDGVRYRQRPFIHSTDTRFLDTGIFEATGETHYGLEFAAVRKRWHVAAETHWLTASRPAASDPTFFGGYAEVGYYLTPGDSRVYKNGIFDRSPPHHPVNEGGIGSIQLTLRYDYLDLDDRDIRGGKQSGYIVGLIWSPIDYLRFNANYAHLDYSGGVIDQTRHSDFGVDVFGLRAELDY